MFFDDALEQFTSLLGFFIDFAIDADFVARSQVPGIALRFLEVHPSLGFRKHGIVGLRSNLRSEGRSVGEFKACEPSRRRFFAAVLVTFGQDGAHLR